MRHGRGWWQYILYNYIFIRLQIISCVNDGSRYPCRHRWIAWIVLSSDEFTGHCAWWHDHRISMECYYTVADPGEHKKTAHYQTWRRAACRNHCLYHAGFIQQAHCLVGLHWSSLRNLAPVGVITLTCSACPDRDASGASASRSNRYHTRNIRWLAGSDECDPRRTQYQIWYTFVMPRCVTLLHGFTHK